jgi:parallel beta-helix repeat protein
MESANNNTLSNIAMSNTSYGIQIVRSSNNTFSGVAASNNSTGIDMYDASNNYFTELLQVGSNSSDCDVTRTAPIVNPGLDDDNDPSDQGNDAVHNGLCIQEGASDFGAAVTGISLAASFVGKVTVDDTVNTSDTIGAATITDLTLAFDWTLFENSYRAWGVDGGPFPDATNRGYLGCSDIAYLNQTDCIASSGTWSASARIWDWSLLSADTILKGLLSLPGGNDTLTHTWSDASTTTFLRNAVELQGDGIGNDDTLCETGEECLYAPNIGSYQGHGNLIPAGIIGTGGTIEDVTLWKYDTNGH